MIVVTLLVPMLLLGAYMYGNQKAYNEVLPFNSALFDPAASQPRDPEGLTFITFRPWRYVEKPIVWPGQLSSFWTLVYSGMWFDVMPKFLPLLRREDPLWWHSYYQWLRGASPAPPTYTPGIERIRWSGSALIAMGIVPVLLFLAGFVRCTRHLIIVCQKRPRNQLIYYEIFVSVLAFNIAGIMYLVWKTPVYSAMKASYLLPSLPSFCVFLAMGIMVWEEKSSFRLFCGGYFTFLFLLVTYNILSMSLAFGG